VSLHDRLAHAGIKEHPSLHATYQRVPSTRRQRVNMHGCPGAFWADKKPPIRWAPLFADEREQTSGEKFGAAVVVDNVLGVPTLVKGTVEHV